MRFRHAVAASIMLLSTLSALAEKPPKRLKLTVGTSAIAVDRATAGGRVLLIGYERTMRGESRVFSRIEREAAADGKGEVAFDLGRPIEADSFWVAVDLSTASYGAVTADGRKLREGEIPSDGIRGGSKQRKEKVVLRFELAYMVVVRPGLGWWEITAGDGGPADADGELNGKIELDATRVKNRAGAYEGIEDYQEGDLLLVFVPRQMGFLVAGVTK